MASRPLTCRTCPSRCRPATALSPAVANGLAGCSDAQFAAARCPERLQGRHRLDQRRRCCPDPLTGSVWIGSPIPGQMYRIFVTASADNVTINLTGQVQPNSEHGPADRRVQQQPAAAVQQPEPAASSAGRWRALANPETLRLVHDDVDDHRRTERPSASPVVVVQHHRLHDPTPFAPSFTAGTTNPTAGAYSPFTLTFSRSGHGQGALGHHRDAAAGPVREDRRRARSARTRPRRGHFAPRPRRSAPRRSARARARTRSS